MRNKHTKLKNSKNRKASSSKWLSRQLNDPYVKKSQSEGYRSRSAYKIMEINNKFQIIKRNMRILDIGAAPGGWCQVTSEILYSDTNKNSSSCKQDELVSEESGGIALNTNHSDTNLIQNIKENHRIIAIDLLPIDKIKGVTSIQKDFYDDDLKQVIMGYTNNQELNLILSDMSPNTTGIKSIDHARIMDMCERTFELAFNILSSGGSVVCKIFQGGAEHTLLAILKQKFSTVKHFKPKSSRPDSKEIYIVALNYKKNK